MSDIVVVDASALVAVAFGESAGAEVLERLADRELVAPKLLEYELTNAAVQKIRIRSDRQAQVTRGLARVLSEDFAIYWSDVEPEATLGLALETGLTGYDAAYLWLALHLDAELVSLDRALDREWRLRSGPQA